MAFNFLDSTLPTGISGSALKLLFQFDPTIDPPPSNQPHDAMQDLSGNNVDLDMRSYAYAVYTEPFSFTDQDEAVLVQLVDRTYSSVSTHTGVINTTGAITVEWIGYCYRVDNNAEHSICCIGEDTSTTEAENVTIRIFTHNSNSADHMGIVVRHERGAGIDEDVQFDWTIPLVMHHGCVTRASDGVTYELYMDGQHLQTKVASNAPTGGAGAVNLYMMCQRTGAYNNMLAMNSYRMCHAEFSAAQVLEAYNRVHV